MTYRKLIRFRVAAWVVAISAMASTAAAAQETGESTRLLRIERVSINAAHVLAESVCEAARETAQSLVARRADPDASAPMIPACRVARLPNESTLAITAGPELQQRIAGLIADLDRTPTTRAFHIVVLAGSRTGSQTADEIPTAAREALADVGEFLPYTSFRVLGSGWLRTSGAGETTLPGSMEFVAGIYFRASSEADAPILIERFEIAQLIPATYNQAGDVAQEATSRSVLETTFTIDPGETVVVGTSKLNGDDGAIVVLLTAVEN